MFHNLCKDFSLTHIYIFAKAEEQWSHPYTTHTDLESDISAISWRLLYRPLCR